MYGSGNVLVWHNPFVNFLEEIAPAVQILWQGKG